MTANRGTCGEKGCEGAALGVALLGQRFCPWHAILFWRLLRGHIEVEAFDRLRVLKQADGLAALDREIARANEAAKGGQR